MADHKLNIPMKAGMISGKGHFHGFHEMDFETILKSNPIPGKGEVVIDEIKKDEEEKEEKPKKKVSKKRKSAELTSTQDKKIQVVFDFGDGIVVPYVFADFLIAEGEVSFVVLKVAKSGPEWSPPPTKKPITLRLEDREYSVWPTGASFNTECGKYLIFVIDEQQDG